MRSAGLCRLADRASAMRRRQRRKSSGSLAMFAAIASSKAPDGVLCEHADRAPPRNILRQGLPVGVAEDEACGSS